MKRFAFFAFLPLTLVLALPALAADSAENLSTFDFRDARFNHMGDSGAVATAKARADSIWLIGGPERSDGKFENASGEPDWEGWTHIDLTAPSEAHWNCSDFNCANLDPGQPGNHAWWCGAMFEPCFTGDPPEGYGDNWQDFLNWTGVVNDPGSSVSVTVTAAINHDTEVAWMSHVPHVVAYAFADALGSAPSAAREVAGAGFRDFTRIARSEPELWGDILTANRKALSAPLQAVAGALARLGRAIDANDADALERHISAARETLSRFSHREDFEQDGAGEGHPISGKT